MRLGREGLMLLEAFQHWALLHKTSGRDVASVSFVQLSLPSLRFHYVGGTGMNVNM